MMAIVSSNAVENRFIRKLPDYDNWLVRKEGGALGGEEKENEGYIVENMENVESGEKAEILWVFYQL